MVRRLERHHVEKQCRIKVGLGVKQRQQKVDNRRAALHEQRVGDARAGRGICGRGVYWRRQKHDRGGGVDFHVLVAVHAEIDGRAVEHTGANSQLAVGLENRTQRRHVEELRVRVLHLVQAHGLPPLRTPLGIVVLREQGPEPRTGVGGRHERWRHAGLACIVQTAALLSSARVVLHQFLRIVNQARGDARDPGTGLVAQNFLPPLLFLVAA